MSSRATFLARRLKRVLRRGFNAAGLDLVRLLPDPRAGGVADDFLWFRALGIRTVVDIGAHRGEFAEYVLGLLPDVQVISFEPLGQAFDVLIERLAGQSRFRGYRCAIGSRAGELSLLRNAYTMSSSFLPMTALHRDAFPVSKRDAGSETVVVKTLDGVLADEMLVANVLIKIDVQGFEDQVLIGAEKTLDKAKAVIVETSFRPLYEGQPLFAQIYAMLNERAFLYRGSLGQLVSPLDGSILQQDALFVRE